MSHPVCLIPSEASVSSSLALCADAPPSLLSARKGKEGSGISQHELFPFYFSSLLPFASLTWDKVTFTEEHHVSLGAPALFSERMPKGVVDGEGLWSRAVEKLKRQQMRMRGASTEEEERKEVELKQGKEEI